MTTIGVPRSEARPVVDVLHGEQVVDRFRWLEDQHSSETRAWISAQNAYLNAYFESLPRTGALRQRVTEFLDVETIQDLHKIKDRYFYRRRRVGDQQPCICMREGLDGEERILIDPALRWASPFITAQIHHISSDGRLLAYKKRKGGERACEIEFLDVESGRVFPCKLPRTQPVSLAFAADGSGFYYVHTETDASGLDYQSVRIHRFDGSVDSDEEVFTAGGDPQLRVFVIADGEARYYITYREGEPHALDYYLAGEKGEATLLFRGIAPPSRVIPNSGRFFVLTPDRASNLRVIEAIPENGDVREVREVVPESTAKIDQLFAVDGALLIVYNTVPATTRVYTSDGTLLSVLITPADGSSRTIHTACDREAVWHSYESFTQPPSLIRADLSTGAAVTWWERFIPDGMPPLNWKHIGYRSHDGCEIPLYVAGRSDVLNSGRPAPTIITGYGGFGIPVRPEFGILTTIMMERGCLFALPNIRGGGEFGPEWHEAARRGKRQTAINDFIAAADYLVETGLTSPGRLASFGGCNGSLLIAAAAIQRPELFRGVLCIAPLFDMLRYHRFHRAFHWAKEYGTSDDPADFVALLGYSPYQGIVDGAAYPAFLIVSGDSDDHVDPMHARKMTARLQEATGSGYPVLLDYSAERGHKPFLPLAERVRALTVRLGFLCEQLGV